jgi:hypothetical protein
MKPNSRLTGPLRGAVACGLALVALSSSLLAPPADAPDWPVAIAVARDSDVYVAFGSDTVTGVIWRFTPDGRVVDRWSAPSGERIGGLDKALNGGVYASRLSATGDAVVHSQPDGSEASRWPVEGLQSGLGTGPLGRVLASSVYVLREDQLGARHVVRFGPTGAEMTSWQVHFSAYDVSVDPWSAPEGIVHVVQLNAISPGFSTVVRYQPDGTRVNEWALLGEAHGIDSKPLGGIVVAVLPELGQSGRLYAFEPDGSSRLLCDLPGRPVDLGVAPSGEIYVIVDLDVYRYTATCELIDHWTHPYPVGTGTLTPTSTGVAATITASLVPSSPTASASDTPGPASRTTTPQAHGGRIHLPLACKRALYC